MEFIHIAAVSPSFGLGVNNQLLYRNQDDLKRFKALTSGHTVVMGRKTYESLGKQYLPNRLNLVISRSLDIGIGLDELKYLLRALESNGDPRVKKVFIIGGGEIYQQTADLVDRLELTVFTDDPVETPDTFYSTTHMDDFTLVKTEPVVSDDNPQRILMHYHTYERRNA